MVDYTEVYHFSWCWSSLGEGSVFLLAFTLVDRELSINLAKNRQWPSSNGFFFFIMITTLHYPVVLCISTQSQKSSHSNVWLNFLYSN